MSRARKMENRCAYLAIAFYSITVGVGIGGAVLAAYGRVTPAVILGGVSFASAILSMLTARASLRWRRVADGGK